MNSSFNERNLFNLIESFLSEEDMTSQEGANQDKLTDIIDEQNLDAPSRGKKRKPSKRKEDVKQEDDDEEEEQKKSFKPKRPEEESLLGDLEKLSDDTSDLSGSQDKERKVPGEDEDRNHEDDAVNFEAFVREVNNLRAGRSLTSSEFKSEVRKYYESLPDSVKTAVYAVIHGFWQVLSGEQFEDALRPKSLGSSCEKTDTSDIKKVVTDDEDIKYTKPEKKKVVKKRVTQQTSSPIVVGNPIKAESFQDKRDILKVLRKNNVI